MLDMGTTRAHTECGECECEGECAGQRQPGQEYQVVGPPQRAGSENTARTPGGSPVGAVQPTAATYLTCCCVYMPCTAGSVGPVLPWQEPPGQRVT